MLDRPAKATGVVSDVVSAPSDVSRVRADALNAWLRGYAETRIDTRLIDERRCVPPHHVLDFGNRGFFGLQIPEKFGGLALTNRDYLRVIEQAAAIDISISMMFFTHNSNGVRPILHYAKPELRDELLPILAAGREIAAFALTEPAAGSNLPNLETRADPDGEGAWRITGVKRWNSSGWAGVVSVFARTVDETGRLGHPTGFVLRQGDAGMRYGPESITMGVRGIIQNALIFDGARVAEDRLLGEVGQGMEVAEEALLNARLAIGAVAVGAMKRCAQLMVRYADRRKVSSGLLIDSPLARDMLTAVSVRVTAMEELIDRLARVLDAGGNPSEEAAQAAKIIGTDALWDASDLLVETLGGRGYMEPNGAPRFMRDCRMLRIIEGANELMCITVGRRIGRSEHFHALMRETLGAADLDDRLREDIEPVTARCMADMGVFGSRSQAMGWAHLQIGRIAVWSLMVAVLDAAERERPTAALARARHWAVERLEDCRRRARCGGGVEQRMIEPQAMRDLVAGYGTDIGDVEEAPPGTEDVLDPLLRRTPTKVGFAPWRHLPGGADGSDIPAPDARRLMAAEMLKNRLSRKSP